MLCYKKLYCDIVIINSADEADMLTQVTPPVEVYSHGTYLFV